ncbi:VWA domain-containing protein [Marispirochaeta sp.]|jgi:Mg-chelatase subunit ChlD|uniref:VWA domain-containing protein n=1 Tax=Marispirochaeta sp. TaxID=2038653 RepID=UPI0029C61B0C|nr:VWA domain-containing protein [Marispirochaeta sp.]
MEESPRGRGRQVRSRMAGSLKGGIALRDTIYRAALDGITDAAGRLRVQPQSLREAVRVEPSGFTVIFTVDASDSMGSVERLAAAKGAALYLLSQAYVRRLKVGMVIFRGESAYTVLEPTSSLSLVRRQLATLAIGEATPLAAGLVKSRELALQVLDRDGSGTALIAVLTDGEANVPLTRGKMTHEELYTMAPDLIHPRLQYLFLDTSPGEPGMLIRNIAAQTGGRYLHLNTGGSDGLINALEGSSED